MPMISVTPIDEMVGDKLVVHPAMLVNPMVVRKIEAVEVAAPKPIVPVTEIGEKEPLAAPPTATAVAPVAPPMLVTMLTFMDGKGMHIKEDMATIKAMGV